jgi:uncharacterized protein YecE (DUF72 family)
MPGLIRVGTSGWNYPTGRGTWNGLFYPARRPRGFDELAWYAEHFDSVEVNSTFYRMPEAPLTARWLIRTPASFVFAVKLFQKFTHPDMYLAQAGAKDWNLSSGDIDLFRAGVDPLADAGRLAALLVQFPPSFHAIPETREYLDWLLNGFSDYPLAVELRHESWRESAAATETRLAASGATWVLADDPFTRLPAASRTPESRAGAAAPRPSAAWEPDLVYIRLHGRNREMWWKHEAAAEDRYNYLYSSDELQPVAAAVSGAAARGRRVLVYLNNHFSAKAVANAAVLKHQLGQLLPGVYPPGIVERYPDLAGLVVTSGLPLSSGALRP